MNAKIRRQLAVRKRRIEKRLDKTKLAGECPVLSASNIHYEIAGRTGAISAAVANCSLSSTSRRTAL